QVVVEHLATVGVVVAQEVLVQPLVMSGEGEPYLVTDDGSGQPHAGVENLQDVGSWYQVGICRQRHGRNRGEQLRPQVRRVVREPHAVTGAIEHGPAVYLVRAGPGNHVEEQTAL